MQSATTTRRHLALIGVGGLLALCVTVAHSPDAQGMALPGIYADWLWCNGAVDDAEGPHIPLSVVRSYMSLMERRNVIRAGLAELRGRDLACWCPLASPCHADVLLELANG